MIRIVYSQCKEHAKLYGVCPLSVLYDYLHARFFYGFCGEDYFLNTPGYAMKNFQKKDFFSHTEWLKIRKKFNDERYTYILQNKVETLKYFSKFINHGWCYPKEQSEEQFNKFVSQYKRILCKPISDEGGNGIHLYQSDFNGGGYNELKSNGLLLEECITQHPLMNFNNTSVNTIRVYSVLDKQGKAHILKAVLRAGVGDSVVDNFHSGGVIYPVNIEHGFIEASGVRRMDRKQVSIHPGTDIIMLGFAIPHWNQLIETVKLMAESLPQVRYIGWDMVITPEGVDMIEANDNADHALFGRIGCERLFLKKLKSLV